MSSYTVHKEMYRSLLNAALKTIVIPLSTVFKRISAAVLIKSLKCGAYLSNYCNLQLNLLHLGQNVITFRTLLHLGQNAITFRTLLHLGRNVITFRTLLHSGLFITFRPSTSLADTKHIFRERKIYLFMGPRISQLAKTTRG